VVRVRWYIYRMKYHVEGSVRTLEEEHIALKSGTVTPTYQTYAACQLIPAPPGPRSPKRRGITPGYNGSSSGGGGGEGVPHDDEHAAAFPSDVPTPDEEVLLRLLEQKEAEGAWRRHVPGAGDAEYGDNGEDDYYGDGGGRSQRERRRTDLEGLDGLERLPTLPPIRQVNCGVLGSSCRRCTAAEGCSWCASGGCVADGDIGRTTCSAGRWYTPRDPSGNECPEDGKTNTITIDTKIDGVSGDINGLYAVHVVYEDGAHSSQPNHIIARRLVLYMPSSTLVAAGALAMSNSYAPNTQPLGELWWNAGVGSSTVSTSIVVDYANHFYNDKLNHADNWLNPVDPYAVGPDYVRSLDQISGILPITGTTHYKGIVRYRGTLIDGGAATPANSQLPDLAVGSATSIATSHVFPAGALLDGKEYKVRPSHAHTRVHECVHQLACTRAFKHARCACAGVAVNSASPSVCGCTGHCVC